MSCDTPLLASKQARPGADGLTSFGPQLRNSHYGRLFTFHTSGQRDVGYLHGQPLRREKRIEKFIQLLSNYCLNWSEAPEKSTKSGL